MSFAERYEDGLLEIKGACPAAIESLRCAVGADGHGLILSCGEFTAAWTPLDTPYSDPVVFEGTDWTQHAESLALAVGQDGREVVLGRGSRGSLWRWERSSGRLLTPRKRSQLLDVRPFGRYPMAIADAGATTVLCTDSSRGGLQRWDAMTGEVLGRPMADGAMQTWALTTAEWNEVAARRQVFMSGGSDGLIHRWDPDSGEEIGPPVAGFGQAVSLAVLQRGDTAPILALINTEGVVHCLDIETGAAVGAGLQTGWHAPRSSKTRLCRGWVATVSTADGSGGVVASCAGPMDAIRMWDSDSGRLLAEVDRDRVGIESVRGLSAAPLADGTPVIFIGDMNGDIHCLDAHTGEAKRAASNPHGMRAWTAVSARLDDGHDVVAVAGRSRVRVFDVEDGQHVGSPPRLWAPGELHALTAVHVGHSRSLLVAATDSGIARLDMSTGLPLPRHEDELTPTIWELAVLASVDLGALVIGGGHDGRVYRWDAITGQASRPPLVGHAGPAKAVAAATSKDEAPMIVSGGEDGCVCCWNALTDEIIAGPYQVATGTVTSLAVVDSAHSGQILLCGDDCGLVHRWDLAVGSPLGDPIVAPGWPRILATIPEADGFTCAVVGHVDSEGREGVNLWRIEDGSAIPSLGFSDNTIAVIQWRGEIATVQAADTGSVTITGHVSAPNT